MGENATLLSELGEAWRGSVGRMPVVAWLLLTAGVVLFLTLGMPLIAALSGPPDPFAGVPERAACRWEQSLIGQTVNLPDQDVQGYPIPRDMRLTVVTLSCTGCAPAESVVRGLSRANVKPLVVCSSNFTDEVKNLLLGKPDEFLILATAPGDGVLPDEMLERAPQAAVIDASGRIIAIPRETQALDEFLAGGGN